MRNVGLSVREELCGCLIYKVSLFIGRVRLRYVTHYFTSFVPYAVLCALWRSLKTACNLLDSFVFKYQNQVAYTVHENLFFFFTKYGNIPYHMV